MYDFRLKKYRTNSYSWLDVHPDVLPLSKSLSATDTNIDIKSVQFLEQFLIDLSWASSHLEGNTYTHLNTEILLKYGEEAKRKDRFKTIMILNHKKAIFFIVEHFDNPKILTAGLIGHIHSLLMKDLLPDHQIGKFRTLPVQISYPYYVPTDNPLIIGTEYGYFVKEIAKVKNPLEASFALLASISYLQPFQDGNKRMARLLSNIPLLRAGMFPFSFKTVNKTDYINALIQFYENPVISEKSRYFSRLYLDEYLKQCVSGNDMEQNDHALSNKTENKPLVVRQYSLIQSIILKFMLRTSDLSGVRTRDLSGLCFTLEVEDESERFFSGDPENAVS